MIVRVWGKADHFALEFNFNSSKNRWTISVPPDLEDGQYACEIHAINTEDQIVTWVGILYILQGKPFLRLLKKLQEIKVNSSETRLKFAPNHCVRFDCMYVVGNL